MLRPDRQVEGDHRQPDLGPGGQVQQVEQPPSQPPRIHRRPNRQKRQQQRDQPQRQCINDDQRYVGPPPRKARQGKGAARSQPLPQRKQREQAKEGCQSQGDLLGHGFHDSRRRRD